MGSLFVKKLALLLVSLIFIFTLIQQSQAGQFDSVNVDAILRNRALVDRHIKCLKCAGPCDKLGSELKRVLPTVAANNCRTCSPQERANLGKIINYAQNNNPQEWQEITAMMRSGRTC